MAAPIAFDPSAEVVIDGRGVILAEVYAEVLDDGRICMRCMRDDGGATDITVRPDFLDALVAARAREAAA